MAPPESQPLTGASSEGSSCCGKLGLLCAGAGLLATGAVLGSAGTMMLRGSQVLMGSGVLGADPRSGLLECGAPGSFEFQAISSITEESQEAIGKGLSLLTTERKECDGGAMPDLPFKTADFLKGENHSHYVHMHHKFATTCSGETYKVHYFIGAPAGKDADTAKTTFITEVHRSITTGAWTMLKANPVACEIQTGVTAYPQQSSTSSEAVKKAADFAAAELAYQMKKGECLGKKDSLVVSEIKSAKTQVAAGLEMELLLLLSPKTEDGTEKSPMSARLWVVEKCDILAAGTCMKELLIPKQEGFYSACTVLKDPASEPLRRLSERFGHIPPDATEELVARREMLAPRRLGSSASTSRPPIMLRHIEKGTMPSSYDPRDGSDCFKHVVAYDQGSCGSCYANAVAQMIGMRHCIQDKKETGASDVLSARRLSKAGLGKAEVPAHLRMLGRTGDKIEESESEDSACADDGLWRDSYGDGCDWYLDHDAGCTKYVDVGQLTHCKTTCDSCPAPVDDYEESDDNPWSQAWYQYMPSVSDMAPCTVDGSGNTMGCDGGNTASIWNNWMRKLDRDLWVMGETCKAYDLKCWSTDPGAVVNTNTGGSCSGYEDYQLWHTPCSCISGSERPSEYVCPTAKPTKDCGHPVPAAIFTVKNMAHGLSNAEAVKNMQRHIHEYGPIYVSFLVASKFMSWDFNKNPIYTGGGSNMGGHAIIAAGWGAQDGMDYWLMKNSWGDSYVDHGYFKFRRGVNLDNLEASEATAAMPVDDYADWSAPYCDITETLLMESHSGTKLLEYDMKFKVVCDKDASIDAFISNLLTDRDQIYSGVSGTSKSKDVKGQKTAEVTVDMICRKFGLKSGETWIYMAAKDKNGNEAKTSHFIAVPAVAGMKSSKSCR